MGSKFGSAVLIAAFAASPGVVPSGWAQDRIDPANSIKFDLKDDAPVRVEAADSSESRVSPRGGALVIDLHVAARLRNNSNDYIRSVTLLLSAQEANPGGRNSVSFPVVNAAPGETFPVRIDGRLMRPAQGVNGPLVRITVDGVLFRSYEFYGPDRLNSHRQMLAWAMQSDRDRKYFKQVLQTKGSAGLQREMLDSLTRQTDRPRLDVQLAARGRATTGVSSPDHLAKFAFLEIPESPIKPTSGWAEIARNEARYPKIEIQNTSPKHIRYVEIAWLVRDLQGREYMAGSVPASDGELYLPPGRAARLLQDTSLRFSRHSGQPVDIQNMTGFVSEVEYSDGNIWIPTRESLQRRDLLRVLPPSPEEQHLADLCHRQGIEALIRELSKF
jgi:hypothetical protein